MSAIPDTIKLIDETFKDENIRASLKDYVFVLDSAEAATKGVAPKDQIIDMLVTALFAPMNNPFSVIMGPMSRPVILEILREGGSDWAVRFLERMIPLTKTVENGANVREYFNVYKDVKRRLP